MNRFVIRTGSLEGWRFIGSLRTELCSISKPAKLPNKEHNQRNAERLCSLRAQILGSQFVAPKMIGIRRELVLGDF